MLRVLSAALLVSLGTLVSGQTLPEISIQNIDFGINPEYNNWRHNADTDTFLVVPITMDVFVDGIDSFSFNLVYDPNTMEPFENGHEINDPGYIMLQNYLGGVPFPMVDGRYFSMKPFSIPNGMKMLTVSYSDSIPFTIGGHGNSSGLLIYVPFKTHNKCINGIDSVLAWNGYVDSLSTFVNPYQTTSFVLSGSMGTYSTDSNTLMVNNGSLTFVTVQALVTEFANNLEGSANHGVAPYQFEWSTGETSQNITPSASGDYWVMVTDAMGCSDTSSMYSYSPSVGIADQKHNHVAVYPNPFTNMLKIQAKGKIRVTMFDLLGKILILQTGSDEVHIMRNELTPGVYLLQIDLDSKTIYKKVSIN
jgi:hypothetical protein